MILAHHIIFGAYGYWLPNDPRGSESLLVRGEKLQEFGPATKVEGHAFVARKRHDRALRLEAKKVLDHEPVLFSGVQALAVATGFGNCAARTGATVWACSVMPDHAHLVVAAHRYEIEKLCNLLKGDATRELTRQEVHPFQGQVGPKNRVPSCFARKWWVIYKDNEAAVLNAIEYVERNPLKAGLPRQTWSFVTPYPERRPTPTKGGHR